MKTAIFDLETSSLYANTGIVLCCQIKTFGHKEVKTIRADKFPNWKTKKSDNRRVVGDIMDALDDYDILVAHNGQYFDKAWLNSACLKYGLRPSLRWRKFVDPVQSARRHMRMARNSLVSLIDYFDLQESKTSLRFKHWLQASLDGDQRSMDVISHHCKMDVVTLEKIYDIMRPLIIKIDERGSS